MDKQQVIYMLTNLFEAILESHKLSDRYEDGEYVDYVDINVSELASLFAKTIQQVRHYR